MTYNLTFGTSVWLETYVWARTCRGMHTIMSVCSLLATCYYLYSRHSNYTAQKVIKIIAVVAAFRLEKNHIRQFAHVFLGWRNILWQLLLIDLRYDMQFITLQKYHQLAYADRQLSQNAVIYSMHQRHRLLPTAYHYLYVNIRRATHAYCSFSFLTHVR